MLNNTQLINTFVELVKMDTQSKEDAPQCPSTKGQLEAQAVVKNKLISLGLTNATIDEKGFLFATLPTNCNSKITIGLLAHIDTSAEASGTNVNPQFHKNYAGKDIVLTNNITISPTDYPELLKCLGDTIITADGTTLLGADDKAGIAEILAALEFFKQHPEIQRPHIRVGITPDEETGSGVANFDVARFGADCAYTLDGSFTGDLCYETFSANKGVITITGLNTHPGYAKDKMISSIRYAYRFLEELPSDQRPEKTNGYQGFFHPYQIEGGVGKTTITMLLRDFTEEGLEEKTRILNEVKEKILKEEPKLQIDVAITKQYRNMKDHIQARPEVLEMAKKAMLATGIEPDIRPIRGGTDGSSLSERGLPTPNIFAGFEAYHGPKEWISTKVMGLAVCHIVNLMQLWAK